MNQETFHGRWEEIKGVLKQKWGKLTDDNLMEIEGNYERIYGILEQHYGYAKNKAQEDFNEIVKKFKGESL